MAPDVSIISYSPVEMIGTKNQPVILTAQNKNLGWGVFAILGQTATPDNSSGSPGNVNNIENIIVEYGGEAIVNGAYFSGQLAVHYADSEIKNSIFRFAKGDDGLNLKSAQTLVENCLFEKNSMDGFDADWMSGEIKNNIFKTMAMTD